MFGEASHETRRRLFFKFSNAGCARAWHWPGTPCIAVAGDIQVARRSPPSRRKPSMFDLQTGGPCYNGFACQGQQEAGCNVAIRVAAHIRPCRAVVLSHATCFTVAIPVEATCALWLSARIRPRGNVLDSWPALRSALLASHYQPKHSNLRSSPVVWRNRSLHRSMATPDKRLLAPHTSGEISNADAQTRFPLSLFPAWEGRGLRRRTFDPWDRRQCVQQHCGRTRVASCYGASVSCTRHPGVTRGTKRFCVDGSKQSVQTTCHRCNLLGS